MSSALSLSAAAWAPFDGAGPIEALRTAQQRPLLLIGDGDSPLTATAAVLKDFPPRRLVEIGKSPFLARRLRPPEIDTRARYLTYRRF